MDYDFIVAFIEKQSKRFLIREIAYDHYGAEKLRRGKHPVLDWNMRNLIVETDAAGNIKPSKRKSSEKVDGAVAMVMGFARATVGGGIQMSNYDQRGLISF